MFNFLKNRKLINQASDELMVVLNQYARNPKFFGDGLIADDPDGRFEAVTLFATAIFIGLAHRGEFEKEVSQKVFDKVFKTFDQALRVLGISDMKVGARIKIMAESFYGRQNSYIKAYEAEDKVILSTKIALNVLEIPNQTTQFSDELANSFRALVDEIKAKEFLA